MRRVEQKEHRDACRHRKAGSWPQPTQRNRVARISATITLTFEQKIAGVVQTVRSDRHGTGPLHDIALERDQRDRHHGGEQHDDNAEIAALDRSG